MPPFACIFNSEHSPTYGVVRFRRLARVKFCTIQNWIHIWSTVYVYTRESSWNANFSTVEPDWLHHDLPTECVATHQFFWPPLFNCTFIPAMENMDCLL